jgi:Domain of unknown function (DUF1906)
MSSRLRLVALLVGGAALLAGCVPGPSAPSVGSTYTGYGFDTCKAPSTNQMAAVTSGSPFRSIGVYIGGSAAACKPGNGSNPNLNASWISTVEGWGWRLIPIYVGSQAPCVNQPNLPTINSFDPGTDALNEASDAIAQAKSLGLGPSTPIYFDMEAYGSDPGCVNVVRTFMSDWNFWMHYSGYTSGFYSSGASGITDEVNVLINNLPYGVPDDIWIAHWLAPSGSCPGYLSWPSNLGDRYVPSIYWSNHQRHRQFCGGVTANFGGPLPMDLDISDGSVASG